MIHILLVDDHTMIREALRVMLERDGLIKIVAEAGEGESALRLAAEFNPDVVVMDITLPGLSGIEVTQRLKATHPAIKVLALSTHLDRSIVQLMLNVGASGYIVKSAAGTSLLQGIHSVAEGRGFLCPEAAALVASNLPAQQIAPGKSSKRTLTKRETQVLVMFAHGKSAPDIATELNLASGTIDVHRRNIMHKLDLHKAVDLTKYAIRAGLITI